MKRFTLYTYRNREEFEIFYEQKVEEGYCITPFIFQETKKLLEEESDTIIDISSLIEYLTINTADIIPASNNFLPANEYTQFIILESLSGKALDIFRLYFKEKVPLYSAQILEESSIKVVKKILPFKRINLYSYKDSDELEQIIQYLNKESKPFVSFSQINDDLLKGLNTKTELFVDITSLVLAIKDNSSLIYYAEKLFIENPKFKVITHSDNVKKALEYFRLIFNELQTIRNIIPIEIKNEESENKLVKITDFTKEEVNGVIEVISNKLFGHKRFKDELPRAINNFIFLNKIKEKKVFSIFLLGNSGLGKSEFATLLKNQLNPNTPMVKINFGNYSSQDALNSLIGSPRGFIGSEEGELSNKLVKSKVGIILCDEFEKANFQIFNFFLELLEDGVFTDSQSREHDLNGYIIIFTSNLDSAGFYKQIPTELQSRLDLICEYSPLTEYEKSEFVSFFVDEFISKINKDGSLTVNLSPEDIQSIKCTNFQTVENIRDIKRILIKKILNRKSNSILQLV
jgi:ATP-dependent Clp protease ATP-binding subunit ClpA